jgi:hypothetical protein
LSASEADLNATPEALEATQGAVLGTNSREPGAAPAFPYAHRGMA